MTNTLVDIYIDVDSTIFPLVDVLSTFKSYEGITYQDVDSWDFLVYHAGKETFTEALHYSFHQNPQPIEKCLLYIKLLYQNKHFEIHFLSNRNPKFTEITKKWIKESFNFIESPRIELLGYGESKVKHIEKNSKKAILIDDAPHILEEALENEKITPVGLRFPYNQHLSCVTFDWKGIYDRILTIALCIYLERDENADK